MLPLLVVVDDFGSPAPGHTPAISLRSLASPFDTKEDGGAFGLPMSDLWSAVGHLRYVPSAGVLLLSI